MTQFKKPFLKWAGGKFALLKQIQPHLPTGNKLIEPFLGSGALFLNSNYEHYHLNDINADLINLYQTVQQQADVYIQAAKKYFTARHNHEKKYYQHRTQFNASQDKFEKALLFLYLNRHGYNGLCRYNSSGHFNVPFGRYIKPYFPENELWFFHEKAQRATFSCVDYQEVFTQAKAHDVIYCDPPYAPLSTTASFTRYTAKSFGQQEQLQLVQQAQQASQRGVHVLVSNHDTDFTRQCYQDKVIHAFKVRRYISCKSAERAMVKELLAYYSAQI